MTLVLAGSCGVLALLFLVARSAARRTDAANRRLSAGEPDVAGEGSLLDRAAHRLGSAGRAGRLKSSLQASGLPVTWRGFCVAWGCLFVAVPALAYFLTGSAVAIPLAVTSVLAVPGPTLKLLRRREERRSREECDRLAADIALYLRCGIPIGAALGLCSETRGLFEQHLARARAQIELGSRADEALMRLSADLDSSDLHLIAGAAMTSRETGADVRGVMDAVGEAVRDRASIRRELSGQTVQGRLSGRIVAALPFLFLAISTLLSRDAARVLFGTTPGLIMLCVGAALDAAGFLWIRKILDIRT